MKLIVVCEFSGRVRDAFIKRGVDAVSCDIKPSDSLKGPHIQGDCRDIDYSEYDAMIAFPPCTYLTCTANRWLYHPEDQDFPIELRRPHPRYPFRKSMQSKAALFVQWLWWRPVKHIAIENPVGVLAQTIGPPTQYIQPYYFGDPQRKKTCLWLKNLPKLKITNKVEPIVHFREGYSDPDWHKHTDPAIRSLTFPGVAAAMADQWLK